MLLEESHVSNCDKELEEREKKEKDDLVEESPIATKEKLASKVKFKIPIATNVPLPFICRFIKKEKNKREILETFEKEEINKPFMDAIKQVPRYDFFQDNESVSMRDSWLAMPQNEFLLETKEVKRYHSDFYSYFSIDTSNFWG